MRTRTLLVLVPMFAAAAGLTAIGCGDDTTGATGGTEAGGPDTGGGTDATKPDTSTGDAAKETGADAAKEAAAACMDASINVATFDSGSPVWACYQQNCAKDDAGMTGTLPLCAADCTCNTAIAGALACVADGGTTTACFTPAIGAGGAAAMNWYLDCVSPFMGMCNAAEGGTTTTDGGEAGTEGGGEAAADTGTDAGTDGGDGATTD